MLTRIDLRHFKRFEMLKLPLRPLTLLSGANASGKSSVLQALVLLHQTMREHEWSSRLIPGRSRKISVLYMARQGASHDASPALLLAYPLRQAGLRRICRAEDHAPVKPFC